MALGGLLRVSGMVLLVDRVRFEHSSRQPREGVVVGDLGQQGLVAELTEDISRISECAG